MLLGNSTFIANAFTPPKRNDHRKTRYDGKCDALTKTAYRTRSHIKHRSSQEANGPPISHTGFRINGRLY